MSAESVLIRKLLAKVAAPDVKLWSNATSKLWAGHYEGRTRAGHVVLSHATVVSAGLCEGSSDLVGLVGPHGRFIGPEVKTPGVALEPHQRRWIEVVRSLGGVAGEVRTEHDLRALIEEARR